MLLSYAVRARELGIVNEIATKLVFDGLFMTITNFNNDHFMAFIREVLAVREEVKTDYLKAGECNDSYSLVVIVLKLKEAFES